MSRHYSKEITQLLKDRAGFLKQNKFKSAAEVCNSLGQLYRKKRQYEEALRYHKEERELSECGGITLDVAVAERNIGEVYIELEDFDKALEHHKNYNEKATESGDRLEMARATFTLGRTYHQKSSFDSDLSKRQIAELLDLAEHCFKESLEMSEICRLRGVKDTEIDSMKGRAVMNIGLVCETRMDLEAAVSRFKQALQIFLRYENSGSKELQEDLWRCFRNLAGALEKLGQFKDAINFAEKALVCSEKLHNTDDQIDDILLICKCHFRMGEFFVPKKLLQRCRVLAKESGTEAKVAEIDKTLEKVVRVRRLRKTLESEEGSKNCRQYEELADLYVSQEIASYRRGVEAYLKCLELNLQTGMNPKNPLLGPIYVSIADTYKDLGELEKVVEYYEKEIECHPDDGKETARSYLAIADVEADLGRDFNEVNNHYTVAFSKAVLAEKFPLAQHVLRCRLEYARNNAPEKVPELENHYKEFCSSHGLDPSSFEDIDTESGLSTSQRSRETDVDLSDLSSDDENDVGGIESDEEPTQTKSRRLRARRPYVSAVSKKDERGETPLHRAAREGNLKKVRTLVMGGADVNAYDNGGWTPLHEAALAGELEIVDYLLKRGADLTRTGVEVFRYVTEGMTPLHDAALGGHINVMELMIEKGANILAKTEKGKTPFDFLRSWRLSREKDRDIDEECRMETIQFEERLLADMKKAGYKESHRGLSHQVSAVVAEGEDYEVKTVPDDIIEYDDSDVDECECAEGVPCAQHRTAAQPVSRKATEEYASAIKGVGSSALSDSHRRTPMSPLRDQDRLRSPRSERKRTPSSEYEPVSRPLKRMFDDREISDSQLRRGFLPDLIPVGSDQEIWPNPRKKPVQPKIDRVFEKASIASPKKMQGYKSIGLRPSSRLDVVTETKQRHQINQPGTSKFVETFTRQLKSPMKPTSVPTTPSAPPPKAVLNTIVQVEGKKLLIPVMDASATIGWLAEEAAKRFSTSDKARRKPILSLEKEGGISLSEDDYVTIVIKDGEVLTARVQNWCSVPPSQKYKEFCASQKSFTYSNIKKAMEELEQTDVFRIVGTSMKANNLFPAIKAVETHFSMVEIDLSGHQIGDDNFQVLVSSMRLMPNLRRLDIHGTSITVVGLKAFTSMLERSTSNSMAPILQNLSDLNISSNAFGDIIGDCLTVILLRLEQLDRLEIENCNLTTKLFEKAEGLEVALQSSNVTRWFIGYNKWGRPGLERWSRLLKGKTLHALSFAGLGADSYADVCTEEFICSALLAIFGGMAHVPLEELNLSECGIHTVSGIQTLNRLLVRAKHLRKLHLDRNTDLTYSEIAAALKGLCQWKSPIEELTLSGVEQIFPHIMFKQPPDGKNPLSSIDDDNFRSFFELLEKFYSIETLVKFEFTLHPKIPEQWAGFIKGMWTAAKGNTGRITQGDRSRVLMICNT